MELSPTGCQGTCERENFNKLPSRTNFSLVATETILMTMSWRIRPSYIMADPATVEIGVEDIAIKQISWK
jgi:hypothetical protein